MKCTIIFAPGFNLLEHEADLVRQVFPPRWGLEYSGTIYATPGPHPIPSWSWEFETQIPSHQVLKRLETGGWGKFILAFYVIF